MKSEKEIVSLTKIAATNTCLGSIGMAYTNHRKASLHPSPNIICSSYSMPSLTLFPSSKIDCRLAHSITPQKPHVAYLDKAPNPHALFSRILFPPFPIYGLEVSFPCTGIVIKFQKLSLYFLCRNPLNYTLEIAGPFRVDK